MGIEISKKKDKAPSTKEDDGKLYPPISTAHFTAVVKHGTGAEQVQEGTVATPGEPGPCKVEVGQGFTKNLGQYNSARFDVRLSVPSTAEGLDAAFEFARGWTDQKLCVLLTAADEAVKGVA